MVRDGNFKVDNGMVHPGERRGSGDLDGVESGEDGVEGVFVQRIVWVRGRVVPVRGFLGFRGVWLSWGQSGLPGGC